MTEWAKPTREPDEAELKRMRATNNPNDEPTGHWTGRCARCGSKNLIDDNTSYGCGDCGAFYIT